MRGRRQLKNQIIDLLDGLGETPDQVATALQQAGVRAVPKSPEGCAVALYVGAVLGADSRVHSVSVGTNCLKATDGQSTPFYFYGTMLIAVPRPVGQFIDAFDGGRYPELVRDTGARREPHPSDA